MAAVTPPNPGSPISYFALEEGVEVWGAEGAVIGKVIQVLAVTDKDIFDGLYITTQYGPRYIDARLIGRLYERRVELTIVADEMQTQPKDRAPAPVIDRTHTPDTPGQGLRARLMSRFRRLK